MNEKHPHSPCFETSQSSALVTLSLKVVVLGIVGSLCPSAFAEQSDAALNDAYRAALHSQQLDPDELKGTEISWIAYCDAEADLQARLAGGTNADSAARESSLKTSTNLRVQELHHLAKDGFSGDVADGPFDQAADSVQSAYSALRKAIAAKGDAALMATLISDQKAWLQFSDLQGDYDGYRSTQAQDVSAHNRQMSMLSMNRLRLVQLQADLAKLGITPSKVAAPASSDSEQDDRNTYVNPDGSLRIEQLAGSSSPGGESEAGLTAWVVSNKTGERAMLPQKDDDDGAGTGRGKPTVDVSEYAISPDSKWIFRTQKFYHGMCGAYLYRRGPGLTFARATSKPLDLMAWEFFQTKTRGFDDITQGGVVNFVKWLPHALRISLNASERLTFGNVNDWVVDYDLKTGKFSVPADRAVHDRQSVDETHR